jgi:hypothetical protein
MILSNSGHFGRLTQGQSVWQADGNGGRPGDDATGCYPAYAQGVPASVPGIGVRDRAG